MEITQAEWIRFKNMLSAINTRAVDDMMDWLESKGGIANVSFQEMSSYGYALATKYGEASASLSAQMYDEVAKASGMTLPAAEVANTVSYTEIAKAITKVAAQTQNAKNVSNVVGRYTKRAGADTTLKNAERDGAQFAWVPSGDSCAFCIALASRGWQYISKKSFKNGHAEHIHSNCDCTYAVRFDKNTNVAGYDPDKYLEMYQNAEGDTWQEKVNSMRRIQYQENKDKINAQKRANYAEKNVKIKQTGGKITGGHHYTVDKKDDVKVEKAKKQYEKYSKTDDSEVIAKNTNFSVEEIQKIRSHIFFEKHDLDEGYQRFEPDYDMAVAWKRLQEGNYLPRDITLLNHELLESYLEKEYNLSAREAHEKTQETYNWVKQLLEETNGKGEKDDLL